jgi:hypothetical protein
MSIPIIVYHHGLLFQGTPPRVNPLAVRIATEQVNALNASGLIKDCSEFHVGLNGGEESQLLAKQIFTRKAMIQYHGLASHNENATIMALWERAKQIDGPAYILYQHQKGCTKTTQSEILHGANWRRMMMHDLVTNWRNCVDLLATHDVVCSHWRWNAADGTQHIPCGNMLWTTAEFVAKLPSMHLRQRIKEDGLGALSSRYEAEIFWGQGEKPRVFQFRPSGAGMP